MFTDFQVRGPHRAQASSSWSPCTPQPPMKCKPGEEFDTPWSSIAPWHRVAMSNCRSKPGRRRRPSTCRQPSISTRSGPAVAGRARRRATVAKCQIKVVLPLPLSCVLMIIHGGTLSIPNYNKLFYIFINISFLLSKCIAHTIYTYKRQSILWFGL